MQDMLAVTQKKQEGARQDLQEGFDSQMKSIENKLLASFKELLEESHSTKGHVDQEEDHTTTQEQQRDEVVSFKEADNYEEAFVAWHKQLGANVPGPIGVHYQMWELRNKHGW